MLQNLDYPSPKSEYSGAIFSWIAGYFTRHGSVSICMNECEEIWMAFNRMMAVRRVYDNVPVRKHNPSQFAANFETTGKSYRLSRSMGTCSDSG
jgi:hypothetical protein